MARRARAGLLQHSAAQGTAEDVGAPGVVVTVFAADGAGAA
jgi:hypothetical protein